VCVYMSKCSYIYEYLYLYCILKKEIDKLIPHIFLLNILSSEVLTHIIQFLNGYLYKFY
jgi:hypothetical protein